MKITDLPATHSHACTVEPPYYGHHSTILTKKVSSLQGMKNYRQLAFNSLTVWWDSILPGFTLLTGSH